MLAAWIKAFAFTFLHDCLSLTARVRSSLFRHARTFTQLEHLFGRRRGKQVHAAGNDAGPPCLVAGPQAGSVVAVEVLVERKKVAPVRVFLKRPGPPVDRPPP